eukprot:scaffold29556_cov61-Attheya_sp.AAC.2
MQWNREREQREREIREMKRQKHPKVPCTTTNQAISFIQLALKHPHQARSVETVSSLFSLIQEERGCDPEISYEQVVRFQKGQAASIGPL